MVSVDDGSVSTLIDLCTYKGISMNNFKLNIYCGRSSLSTENDHCYFLSVGEFFDGRLCQF